MAFSPDGSIFANIGRDGVQLWDAATGERLNIFKEPNSVVNSLSFSPDGKTLAGGGSDTTVRLWDVSTGSEKKVRTGHKHWIYRVAFSPDGQTLASAGVDGTVLLWDITSVTHKTDDEK